MTRKPQSAAIVPIAPRSFAPTQTAMPTIFGPGMNWQRLTTSANSPSLIQRRFSTAIRRAQTIPPPPPIPQSETVRNAVKSAARGTVCSTFCSCAAACVICDLSGIEGGRAATLFMLVRRCKSGYPPVCDSLTTRAAISAKYVLCRRGQQIPGHPKMVRRPSSARRLRSSISGVSTWTDI
jgi:hypothetical protein